MENKNFGEKTQPQGTNFYSAKNMSWAQYKKNILIISAVAFFLIALILLILWNSNKKGSVETANEALDGAIKGTLPSVSNNPLDNKPNLNPVEKTNPINEIKTNPFE